MRLFTIGFALVLLATSAKSASVDGIELYSIDIGEGPTLVFVHGGFANMSNWDAQLEEFADQYRILALDLPGHGMSDSPPNREMSFGLAARAVEAVREEAGVEKVVLIGHSMGVGVIRKYVSLFPEHVAGLVAVDGSLVQAPRGASEPDESSSPEPQPPPTRKSLEIGLSAAFFVPETPVDVRVRVLEMMVPKVLEGGFNQIEEPRLGPETFEAPTLHIAASYSMLDGTMGDPSIIRDTFPNSSIAVIPDTGHFLMMEKPEAFNGLLRDFLENIEF